VLIYQPSCKARWPGRGPARSQTHSVAPLPARPAGPGGVAQLFALCPGGEDMGRMLVLRACAAAMAKQDDQTPVVSVIKASVDLNSDKF